MDKTVFHKIAKHEIEAHIVWEDDDFIAFLDVLPIEPGHVIVITKQPFLSLEEMPDELTSRFFILVKKIGGAMLNGLDVKGYSVFLDNIDKNYTIEEHIQYTHVHIVPRREGYSLERRPQGAYDEGQAEECLEKIKTVLN